jgi:hypothetical protein
LDFLPFHESSALDAEQYGTGLQAYFPQQIVLHDFFRESADGQSQLAKMSGCCRLVEKHAHWRNTRLVNYIFNIVLSHRN